MPPGARPARTADVVIVGGGVTGCSIAFHLAGQGVRDVLVLERRFLASGGTGRSVGVMRQLYPTDATSRMVLHSLRVLAVGAGQRAALARTVEAQRELGIDTRLIGPDDVRELDPRIDPFAVGAAVWEPESGYGDPTGVTAGFARAAARAGVVIEQGAEVVAVEVGGGAIEGVRLATGARVAARVVVNAAGLWSPAVAALAGVTLPIIVGRHPVFVVQRAPEFGRPHPVYLDLASGTFLRPETGGLTLTGFLDADEPNHPLDPEALGSDVSFDEVARIMERASRCMPALGEARYQRGYAGAFDITPDWMPVLDQTSVRGLYVAAGMSGHGFKLSPAVGRMMADLIVRGHSDLADLRAFRLDRFAARPHDDGGAFAHSYLR